MAGGRPSARACTSGSTRSSTRVMRLLLRTTTASTTTLSRGPRRLRGTHLSSSSASSLLSGPKCRSFLRRAANTSSVRSSSADISKHSTCRSQITPTESTYQVNYIKIKLRQKDQTETLTTQHASKYTFFLFRNSAFVAK